MYKVNLLPNHLSPSEAKYDPRKNYFIMGTILMLICLLIVYGLFYSKLILLQSQLEQETKNLVELREKIQPIQRLASMNQRKKEQYLTLSTMIKNRLLWYDLLQELPLALPMDTWLTGIEIKKVENMPRGSGFVSSVLELPARAQKKESKEATADMHQSPPVPNMIYLYGATWSMGSVGVLVDNLGRLPYFANVMLVEARYDQQWKVIKFELAARVKGGERHVQRSTSPKS
ncbi:Fimbrial assembly family protein [Desulforamulus reducens MI-1]|uniref:Fimbrial assembly family protein n=1 Tax=Desulforamulus reducens (strain ATCC BAA-1160 / DSM 100696 / MI-1) TaxID=349161 RepID=A4J3B2_DESRM|nr:PilN domain-containing protein [Desulforamulus reducens]ABO49565.1 Fimbrial assembly family protein [Desulforamulus reducens MI-1]